MTKLPILKLFLYPALGLLGYSAYCYYHEENLKSNPQNSYIVFLNALQEKLNKTQELR